MADSPTAELPASGEDFYHFSTTPNAKLTPIGLLYCHATPQ